MREPRRAILWTVGLMAIGGASLVLGQPATTIDGLRFDNRVRALDFHFTASSSWDAYRITPTGDVAMNPKPHITPVADARLQVQTRPASGSAIELVVRNQNASHQMAINSNGVVAGADLISGLPFGLTFLPRDGKARVGESWNQTFPPPGSENDVRTFITYRYSLKGARPTAACPDCIEIEVIGLRRFLPNTGLERALRRKPNRFADAFLLGDRPFMMGSVLFNRRERFIQRSELSHNVSMLTVTPLEGLEDRVVFERL